MSSLYVHVPFCIKKCDYCAFYSVPLNAHQVSMYENGIAQEIALRKLEAPTGVSSLFIGGGTPTALSASHLETLLSEIHTHYNFVNPINGLQAEKTAEANPGTLDTEKLAVLRKYGINRISLGVQSFHPALLRQIGRIHGVEQILAAVRLIRQAGFDNLNLDLIFGLPGQTLKDWQDTLKKAVAVSPEHLSIYALTLEENTPLGRKYAASCQAGGSHTDLESIGVELKDGRKSYNVIKQDNKQGNFISLPDDDLQADMYEWALAYLHKNGYERYEISNFARPGYACQHNQSYWRSEAYIGLGPGAVSCIEGIRSKNTEEITDYVNKLATGRRPIEQGETEVLTLDQRISEYMMLGLRTTQGVDIQAFLEKFKVPIQDIYGQIMANYVDRGIMCLEQKTLKINPDYLFVANSILQKFIR